MSPESRMAMATSASTGAATTSPTDPRLRSRARFESSFVSFVAVHAAEKRAAAASARTRPIASDAVAAGEGR